MVVQGVRVLGSLRGFEVSVFGGLGGLGESVVLEGSVVWGVSV